MFGAGRLLAALLVTAAAAAASGCTEVEEAWAFERDGSGTCSLRVRWNADLLARVRGVVGDPVAARFAGRAFPLRLEEWRDGVRGLSGVDVRALDEDVEPGGWRVLRTTLHFGRVEDVLAWEVLARRTLRVEAPDAEGRVHLRMEPFADLPVLDPLLAAARAEPERLAEAGVAAPERTLLERLLAPALAGLRLCVRVQVAGRLLGAAAPAVRREGAEAEFVWGAADLAPGRPRAVDLHYRPGEFDRVPLVDHVGEGSGGPR